jgi:hypothetical protein
MRRRALLVCLLSTAAAVGALAALAATAVDHTKLPLGDGRYTTSAKKGWVFSCRQSFNGPGAFRDGPWIDNAAKRWDVTSKLAVQGAALFNSRFATTLGTTRRALAGNGLPPYRTGVFPIASTDPAYEFDRNPNSIQRYILKAALPRNPTVTRTPTCIGGTIGVMRDGIPLYNAFDAGGRDAPAHEIQDRCGGHPERTGQYHYHSLPPCLSDAGTTHSALLGWALDGFGIYGPRGGNGTELGTADLDACHGHTHVVSWNGRRVRMYHYHATYDFPYVVGCYRGTPIASATGLHIGRP